MRHIAKGVEPEFFAQWKRRNAKIVRECQWSEDSIPSEADRERWKGMRRRLKTDMIEREQGYLCCYCESRIAADTSEIEHICPRSKCRPLCFAYSNLLVSCTKTSHCNHHKGSQYDERKFVSPLQSDSATQFRYLPDGSVEANGDSEAAMETIRILNLNARNLREKRELALLTVENSDDGTRQWWLEACRQPSTSELPQFCSAIIDYITRNFGEISR